MLCVLQAYCHDAPKFPTYFWASEANHSYLDPLGLALLVVQMENFGLEMVSLLTESSQAQHTSFQIKKVQQYYHKKICFFAEGKEKYRIEKEKPQISLPLTNCATIARSKCRCANMRKSFLFLSSR